MDQPSSLWDQRKKRCFLCKCINQIVGGEKETEAINENHCGHSTWCTDFVHSAQILFVFLQRGLVALCLQDQETLAEDKAPNLGYK